jgi:hypothetical protein
LFFILNLSAKEIEFFKQVYEAERIGETFVFSENDHEKIKIFQEKYNDVCQSLIDKHLIEGKIDYFCGLTLTKLGKEEIVKVLSNEEKEKDNNKKFKRELWIAIISMATGSVIGSLTTWILMRFA